MSNNSTPPLLIVEDDLALQKQIKWSLDRFESVTADDRESALVQLRRYQPTVVTMDLGLPPDPDSVSEGFKLLEQMLAIDPAIKVIVLTGQNDQANALRAVALGAYDFLAKPFEPEVLSLTIERAQRLAELQAENRRLQSLHQPDALSGLITRDAEMMRLSRTVERVAGSDATVLLLGESGTGKEVLAQGLHAASKRPGRFVAINCAAIPENLLESELFGYEKGAFTGASKTTPGKFESAHNGTLMLDEIGDLPHSLQAKLLRFLQQRTVERLGGRNEIPVDVRVVGATHQDLKALIAEGRFREDLYYRLAEIVITIPPLRARTGDAVLLSHAFLRRFAQDQRRTGLSFSDDAVKAIEQHRWPGNVRELLNAIKRASIMADTDRLTCEDLGLPSPASDDGSTERSDLDLRSVREAAERQAIVAALARSNGNIVKASEILGVSRPTLYDLMRRLSIK
jgi:two-component system, NtrC family, response regulator